MKASLNDLIESELMHRLGWTLLHSIWILALLGMLTVAAMILFRQKSPQARYACAYLGLILMALAPLAMFANSPVKEIDRPKAATVIPTTSESPVMRSSLVQVPAVFGWLKPTILLPMQVLESLTGAQLRMVLAHELALT